MRPAIVIDKEDILAIVAPLGNMMRQAGHIDASDTRHVLMVGGGSCYVREIGDCPARQSVWSPVYVNAMVERDRDTDRDSTTGSNGLDERLYATTDANCDVTALVDTTGAVVERYQYDPYGAPTVLDANWSADEDGISDVGWVNLFQGGRYDSLTQTVHFGERDLYVSLGVGGRPDPLGFPDGLNSCEFEVSNPINYLDPNGTEVKSGPEAKEVAWIPMFDPNTVVDHLPALEAGYRRYHRGVDSIPLGAISLWSATYNLLAESYNLTPPTSFTSTSWGKFVDSKEYRGWLAVQVDIDSSAGPIVHVTSNPGYTPITTSSGRDGGARNVLRYDPGEGSVVASKRNNEDGSWTVTVREYSRIGQLGQEMSRVLTGAGVPFRWAEIQYTISCNGKYNISFAASDLPSTSAYIDNKSVGEKRLSNIPAFIYAGAGVDAPGGTFKTVTGP